MSKDTGDRTGAHLAGRLRHRVQQYAFSSLYRFGGPVYDGLTVLLFGDAWGRWRRSVVPIIANGKVLDLGCGTGVLVAELVKLDYDVVGVDREPSMLARAKRRAACHGHLVRADVLSLPFCDGTFSSVVSTFPAQFVVQRPALDEISRVLRPGGQFVVVLTGQTDEQTRWRWPIRLMLRIFYGADRGDRIPASKPMEHPAMPGEWHWIGHQSCRALLWIAVRNSNDT